MKMTMQIINKNSNLYKICYNQPINEKEKISQKINKSLNKIVFLLNELEELIKNEKELD